MQWKFFYENNERLFLYRIVSMSFKFYALSCICLKILIPVKICSHKND